MPGSWDHGAGAAPERAMGHASPEKYPNGVTPEGTKTNGEKYRPRRSVKIEKMNQHK